MLVGQGLALMYLDPATLRAAGVVPLSQVIETIANLVGRDRLVAALNTRHKRSPRDERIAEQLVRKEVGKAVKGLQRLGFVDDFGDDRLRLRLPLTRFTDAVRGTADPRLALARLAARGDVAIGDADSEAENGEEDIE